MKNSELLQKIYQELTEQSILMREVHAQVCVKATPKVATKKPAAKQVTKKATAPKVAKKAKKPVYTGFSMVSSKIDGKLCLQSADYTLRPFGAIMRKFGGEFVAKLGFDKDQRFWGSWVFPTTSDRLKAIEAIQSCK